MVALILMIVDNIIMKIFIQYPIHFSCLAISLWMEGGAKFYFVPTFFINNVQNSDVNFTSQSFIMISGIPLCQTHMLKNSFAIPATVAFVWVDENFANIKNMSSTIKMAFVPSHSKKHVIKSIETFSNGPDGIRN